MTDNNLAVLKSLTIRPSQAISREIEPVLMDLQKEGYVACGPGGWIATAEGCNLIERKSAAMRSQRRSHAPR